MRLIIHRVNSLDFLQKIPKKYGVEIDVRSSKENLILNHEPFCDGDYLENYLKLCEGRFVVFNIKEAGIEWKVKDLAEKYNLDDYFLLDVEFPFIYNATRFNNFKKIAIRFSEAEPIELALAQKKYLDWVWIDTNTLLPVNKSNVHLLSDFKTCLVCPERWNRPEDINIYKQLMKNLNFEPDAVMTNINYVKMWEDNH